ncbi:protein MIS12 homolog isoform X2 [Malania oleifera]|uniref:protein MIS12 homolog isoform X2 n=1 Tax=Malania oleifera TaxID=397392 RepID=UPI0025AE1FC4|nr:protein MIS12 homolog isoform X2 [Malania oleifera]
MEGSESEAVFESLNLNPQLFINEVLNSVGDLFDGAFDFYQQQASTLLKAEGTDRAQDLDEGIAYIRNMIQEAFDKRLGMWEKYCLRNCFVVPEGFALPKADLSPEKMIGTAKAYKGLYYFEENESPGDSSIDQDAFCDPELDAQLDSLRDKLSMVGKESAELDCELQALEKQSIISNHCDASINEELQLYEQNPSHEMLQELRTKMEKRKTRKEKVIEQMKPAQMYNRNNDLPMINYNEGPFKATLEDLQEFMADINKLGES